MTAAISSRDERVLLADIGGTNARFALADIAADTPLLVDSVGALGGPMFALVAMSLGALLTLRFGPRGASPITVSATH